MTKRVLDNNRELQFRVSLVTGLVWESIQLLRRSMLNSWLIISWLSWTNCPSRQTTWPRLCSSPRRTSKDQVVGSREEEKGKMRCRFYNSESGCKKGKDCEWLHESRDDRRRCWTCGAVDHMSPACSRPKGSGGSSPQNHSKQKLMKSEVEEKPTGQKESSDTQSVSSGSSIKELLEEAGRMLKSVTGEGSPTSSTATSREGELMIVFNNN